MENKYLDILGAIYGIKGESEFPDIWDLWNETPEEMVKALKREGTEVGYFGADISDGITCIFEDGELKLTGYISTRGPLYQAGAYDGEQEYGANNVAHVTGSCVPEDEWIEADGYISADIAKDAWDLIPKKGS